MKNNISIIYQYLSVDAFEKMMNHKTIKLSNIMKSNDSSELLLSYDVLDNLIFDKYSKKIKISKTFKDIKDVVKFHNDSIEHIKRSEPKIHTQYVSCFSSNGDMLSQWRGYGNLAKISTKAISKSSKEGNDSCYFDDYDMSCGISVGFDSKKMNGLFNGENARLNNVSFGKVSYSSSKQKSLFREHARKLLQILDSEDTKMNFVFGKSNAYSIVYQDAIIQKAPYVKNKFFKEEKEYRICLWDSGAPIKHEITIKDKIKIESKVDAIKNKKEYYVYFEDYFDRYIKEIIIGPNCKYDETKVKKILKSNKIKAKVKYSLGHDIFIKSKNREQF